MDAPFTLQNKLSDEITALKGENAERQKNMLKNHGISLLIEVL